MLNKSNDILISGLTIHTEDAVLIGAQLSVSQGKIQSISPHSVSHKGVNHYQFPAGYHLIPGMIDMHIHGSGGADVMDASKDALDTIRKTLVQTGVTAFLATTMTSSANEIECTLQNIADYQRAKDKPPGAHILGVHLEGPFVAPEQPGAHYKEWFLTPNIALFERWQASADGHIKLVTIAPELPDAMTLIDYLHKNNVIASIGHSHASYEIACQAITAGATHATHLFNAMRGLHHRDPGCVGAILLDNRVVAELIADGIHLNPATIELALKMKGAEGLVLVTDAMRAQCMGEGEFDLGASSLKVIVKDGAVRLLDGTLAASVLTMNQALKNMLAMTTCPFHKLLHLVSKNPAKSLKLFSNKGSIAEGKDADLVVLNEHLEVVMTIVDGMICYYKT